MNEVFLPILPYFPNVYTKYDGDNSTILDDKICAVMSHSINICEMVDVNPVIMFKVLLKLTSLKRS